MKPEEDLIRAALDGDSQAYGYLVDRFQARLFNSMLPVVGSHEEAEDIVQESFVQAYIKLDTFQGNSRFFTWLYRIAFNNALSRQRRKRHDLSLDQSREITGSDPHDRLEPPDEPLLRQERVSMVHQALDQLTEEHRAILVLREMDGLSYEEIAEISRHQHRHGPQSPVTGPKPTEGSTGTATAMTSGLPRAASVLPASAIRSWCHPRERDTAARHLGR